MPMSMPILNESPLKVGGTVLAIYAPFGTDEVLSTFPEKATLSVETHPLVAAMKGVAAAGTQVVALVDRFDDDTWLVEVPAGAPEAIRFTPRWKQDMASHRTLTGFLLEVHRKAPGAAMVLALEGHGAGYLPELDRRLLTWKNTTEDGRFEWHFSDQDSAPVKSSGDPVLPMGYPGLPMGYPGLPVNHSFMSTWALGKALSNAVKQGCPRPSVIHFNNCFNMSVEVLHTVAPYADYAAGYNNYNFFTSGAAYPAVFQKLQAQGSASAQDLAQWFSDENHAGLAAKGHHPTVGGVVHLARMEGIATGIDSLSDALLDAMRSASLADRPAVLDMIQKAIEMAQQYDSEPGWQLETPDQLTDICSFAAALGSVASSFPAVQSAAWTLVKLLDGIKRYGDRDTPWLDDTGTITWDFTEKTLAMNIFLPDPVRTGQWDWRSTYYVDVNPDPSKPLVQPGVIEFLKATNWVEFLVEYHKEVKFKSFHVGSIPQLPPFNGKYDGGSKPPTTGGTPPAGGGGTTVPRQPRFRWPLGRIGIRLSVLLSTDKPGDQPA